ncbi:MAG: site-specific DNA-methyltransferase, partial [Actinomycetota bacterium]
EAIKRHADFELLYDKPFEDKKKVRVTGPFTVESLSPHRSLAVAGQVPDEVAARAAVVGASADGSAEPSRSEQAGDLDAAAEFESMILDNLSRSGIQNGRKDERMTFQTVEPYAGNYVQAVGERVDLSADGETGEVVERVGIAVGPQYGTVGQSFVKDAARECLQADGIDLLAVLAFSYDPNAIKHGDDYETGEDGFEVGGRHKLGRLPVLLVRMNSDLIMGRDLKKTGSGNLFTVFGEPDIELVHGVGDSGDQMQVVLHGVDVYDPNTGTVRSNDTSQIALWMVDTDYDEESFFVRHCYFTGGNDPYKRLKTALKSDIDADAWATLYDTTSRPFARPSTGKIAVKVINDYGDEVMQAIEVGDSLA